MPKKLATSLVPGSLVRPRGALIQRKCACHERSGFEPEESGEHKAVLRRRSIDTGESRAAPPIVHDVLRSSGQPLDSATRGFMENRFGHDFGRVRVHTDATAARSARQVGAAAYTVDKNIVFGAGRYAPASSEGSRLMAHELAHVVQQSSTGGGGGARSELEIGPDDDPAEREAEAASARIVAAEGPRPTAAYRPGHAESSPPRLQRQSSGDQPNKEPRPLIPIPIFDRLDLKPIAPLPGGFSPPSLEDVNKGIHGLPGQSGGEPADNHCLPGWRFRQTGDAAGLCCPVESSAVDKDKCCPPKQLRMTVTGTKCDRTAAVGEGGSPHPEQGTQPQPQSPADPTGESSFTLKLPAQTPPLTVDFPIHFKQDQPGAAVTGEKAVRSSLTAAGGSDLDAVIAWLRRGTAFSVQLTGMASVEGPPAHNQQLGEDRVRSIASVLIQNGISAARIADPPGQSAACASLGAGLRNCGDSQASKTIDPNDRQVRARVFIPPSP